MLSMLILVMVADLSTILQDRIFRPIISFYALKEKMSVSKSNIRCHMRCKMQCAIGCYVHYAI